MKKEDFNSEWQFVKGYVPSLKVLAMYGKQAQKITLPHDAMIHETRDENTKNGGATGFYPGGVYTYFKTFPVSQEWEEKTVILEFEDKMAEVLADTSIDESRIAAEVILYADKICVDEETVRLRSHITHARQCLSEDGGIGRKLDFIAQEMNREANTTLSKANDIEISNAAIDLKTEIEKVREQIQNIE